MTAEATTFVYEYPDGQTPLFYLKDNWILTYPAGDRRYVSRNGAWHPLPQGGAPELRVHEGFVFDYPTSQTPRYYLREVAP